MCKIISIRISTTFFLFEVFKFGFAPLSINGFINSLFFIPPKIRYKKVVIPS